MGAINRILSPVFFLLYSHKKDLDKSLRNPLFTEQLSTLWNKVNDYSVHSTCP